VGARTEPGVETREASPEFLERAGAAAWKARFFPDFVKAAWVAGIAALQVHRPDAEPTCDPNVDGIGLRQRTTRDGCGRLDEKRGDHKLYS